MVTWEIIIKLTHFEFEILYFLASHPGQVAFASQFIESKGIYIDGELLKDNTSYMRSALVASSADFSDLGDRRKPEYLERIVTDALYRGSQMEKLVIRQIELTGLKVTEDDIRKVVYWNRKEYREDDSKERCFSRRNER